MEEDSIITRVAIPADVRFVYQILDAMEAGASTAMLFYRFNYIFTVVIRKSGRNP
jgi:hypothetical protein